MSAPAIRLVRTAVLPYLESIPDTPPPDSGWPVLCFLHGYEEGSPMEVRTALTRHGPLRPDSARIAVREFIVLAPQLPARGDLWMQYASAVQEIVRHVQTSLAADRARTYLTGFSYGANGVFDLALRQAGLWAALWPVDPTRVPAADPALPVWFSSGEVSRRGEQRFIERLGLEPVAADSPGDRVLDDAGESHVGTATHAYRDERIYRWLLEHRR